MNSNIEKIEYVGKDGYIARAGELGIPKINDAWIKMLNEMEEERITFELRGEFRLPYINADNWIGTKSNK